MTQQDDAFIRHMQEELEYESRRYEYPPCQECGAYTAEEAEAKCICSGDKDSCHGCYLWPDGSEQQRKE